MAEIHDAEQRYQMALRLLKDTGKELCFTQKRLKYIGAMAGRRGRRFVSLLEAQLRARVKFEPET